MRAILILIVTVFAIGRLAQEQALPVWRVLPEDIEQGSVRKVRLSTNYFAVRFTYTRPGAKKMLAFEREHAGQEVVVAVGSFERRSRIAWPDITVPGWTEEGYLEFRGDKIYGVSEEDASKIIEALTGMPPDALNGAWLRNFSVLNLRLAIDPKVT